MRHIVIMVIAMLISLSETMIANAITVDDCFKEFSSEPKAEHVNINSFLMWFAKRFAGNEPELKNVDSVKVLDLEECTESVKTRFAKRMSELQFDGLDELVNVSEDGNRVRILGKIKRDKLHKLIVVCYGSEDCCLVEINGKFDMSELYGVVKSQIPKHDDC